MSPGVSTFMFANAGSNRSYRPFGVNEGHHSLSHIKMTGQAGKDQQDQHFPRRAALVYVQKMKSIPEGDGRCSTIDDRLWQRHQRWNRHNNENLPFTRRSWWGWIRPGRQSSILETPANNLFVTMLNQAGATTDSFNDSTGTLPFLS
ncbi:MAG: hypothetical protein CM1200mP29_09370 [Verrucomicrobiota bacterium]|nr:MAG: hypothetical protein CM1200mP29_09370 [Verrucomicrobiota bacterium]